MKVLFVSQYADPVVLGGNNNVYRQAQALREIGIDARILTWPHDDGWTGDPSPTDEDTLHRRGVPYHVVRLPDALCDRVPRQAEWQRGKRLGEQILKRLHPEVVHLHHWRGMSSIAAAAIDLRIPTVYTAHDWGLACMRTVLRRGDGSFCDDIPEANLCSACVWSGRSILGKINEVGASLSAGRLALSALRRHATSGRLGLVVESLATRTEQNLARAKQILTSLGALVVPNRFGQQFFERLGAQPRRIHVMPWFCDERPEGACWVQHKEQLRLGYIGRIAPEKGLDVLLRALAQTPRSCSVTLKIAGRVDSRYGEALQSAYSTAAGSHQLEWCGWIPRERFHEYYSEIDVVAVPSQAMDNTPLSLIEAFAHRKPVLASNLATIQDLVENQRNGLLVPHNEVAAWSGAIARLCNEPALLTRMRHQVPRISTSRQYAERLRDIYHSARENSNYSDGALDR
jgi:glycosyltransferase involved in cell wall biosynthesis